MRESDRILATDLRDAGLDHLAERAENSEWNDYFGPATMPQHDLIATLHAEIKLANIIRKRLIQNVIDGKYDATLTEGNEWAASPEGQASFRELDLAREPKPRGYE